MGLTTAVTDETFEGEIEKHEGLAVVDFWAAWCGPCRIIAPILDQLASEYDGKAKVAKLDVEDADLRVEHERAARDHAAAGDALERARLAMDGLRVDRATRESELTGARAQRDDKFGQGRLVQGHRCVLLGSFLLELTKDHADGSPAGGPTKAHHSAGLYLSQPSCETIRTADVYEYP